MDAEHYHDKQRDVDSKSIEAAEHFIQMTFIRQVYYMVLLLLIFTTGLMYVFRYAKVCCGWAAKTSVFWIICGSLTMIFLNILSVSGHIHQVFPYNLVLFLVLLIAKSLIVAGVTCKTIPDILYMACGVTLLVMVLPTMLVTKDFTVYKTQMHIVSIVMLAIGTIYRFGRDTIFFCYSLVGIILYSCYLISDNQMVVIGKYRYSLTTDDRILGAMHVYVDIINIFINVQSVVSYVLVWHSRQRRIIIINESYVIHSICNCQSSFTRILFLSCSCIKSKTRTRSLKARQDKNLSSKKSARIARFS